jgi:sulfur dioxygenase
MLFRQLFDPDTSTYTYLLADQASGEAVIIDPVIEQIDRDVQLLRDLNLTLRYALDTHVHADHVTALGTLRERLGCQTVLSHRAEVGCCDIKAHDGDLIKFGQHSLRVLETPGHTAGCLSFVTDDQSMVFTGDALLIRGCGRTDFQQGSASTLYASVNQKLFTLPKQTSVYPGHDYKGRISSSIDEEMRCNPRLNTSQTEADFVKTMAGLTLAYPKQIDAALPRNLQCGMVTGEVLAARSWAPIETTADGIPEVAPEWVLHHRAEVQIIDVREPAELQSELGHIEGCVPMPLGNLETTLAGLPRETPTIMVCRSGARSGKATLLAQKLGFTTLANMRGGMLAWNQRALPIARQ